MISSLDVFGAEILIVDDRENNVTLLKHALRTAGYGSVTSTREPGDVCGLHRLNRYTLILLDLQMASRGGLEVMKDLKEIDTGEELTVVAVSADPEHRSAALRAGARDFIEKPFSAADLTSRIFRVIEERLRGSSKVDHDQVRQKAAAREFSSKGPIVIDFPMLASEPLLTAEPLGSDAEEECVGN